MAAKMEKWSLVARPPPSTGGCDLERPRGYSYNQVILVSGTPMTLHKVNRGLRLPIEGEPVQEIDTARSPSRVALLAADYVGMRPTMQVAVGDIVKRGQPLFDDKKMPGVRYTSPGAGKVVAINRGEQIGRASCRERV